MADIRAKYGMKNTEKSDFFHTSVYAKAQDNSDIGAASDPASFATRQALDEQRKYIQKYRNSRLIQGLRAYDRVKSYTPRVENSADVARGRGSLTPDTTPAQRTNSLSSTPSTSTTMQGAAANITRNFSGRANTPSSPTRPRPPISFHP